MPQRSTLNSTDCPACPHRAVHETLRACALQLDAASKGRQRKAAAAELDRAEAQLVKYQHRISAGQSGEGLPKVRGLAALVVLDFFGFRV